MVIENEPVAVDPSVVRFIVTADERAQIENEAEKLHLTMSAFIRLLVKQWADGVTFEKK